MESERLAIFVRTAGDRGPSRNWPILGASADDRVGQLDILNDALQFAFVLFSDLAAKDDGELVGLTDSAIGIQ